MKLFVKILFSCAILSVAVIFGMFLHSNIVYSEIEKTKQDFTQKPTSIDKEILFALINQFRINENQNPYRESDILCKIALDRVDDEKLDNHKGFFDKYSNLPYSLSENLGEANSEKELLTAWLQSKTHAEILWKRYEYSCLKCQDNYCVMIFSNLEN